MELMTPRPLFPGARVALLAPASAADPELLTPAAEAVRALGLEPVIYPSCRPEHRHGYFAADDTQRAADLNR
ncbi:MAG: LD-carboxypeptidase, partial [Pseudoflavonifractor sp.]